MQRNTVSNELELIEHKDKVTKKKLNEENGGKKENWNNVKRAVKMYENALNRMNRRGTEQHLKQQTQQ